MTFGQIALAATGVDIANLPFGAVVAVAQLVDCKPTRDLREGITIQEYQWGDYTPDRFGWILEDVRRLSAPLSAKGAQGLWNWDPPAGFDLDESFQI